MIEKKYSEAGRILIISVCTVFSDFTSVKRCEDVEPSCHCVHTSMTLVFLFLSFFLSFSPLSHRFFALRISFPNQCLFNFPYWKQVFARKRMNFENQNSCAEFTVKLFHHQHPGDSGEIPKTVKSPPLCTIILTKTHKRYNPCISCVFTIHKSLEFFFIVCLRVC